MSWGPNARLMYRGRKLAMREARRRERAYSAPRPQKQPSYTASPQMPRQQSAVSGIPTVDAADCADTVARWQSSIAFIALFTSVLLANLGVFTPLWIVACLLWFIGSLIYFSRCSARLTQAKAAAFAFDYYQETMRVPEKVGGSVATPAVTEKAVPPSEGTPEPCIVQQRPASPRKHRSQQDWDNRLREESRWQKAAKNGEVYKDY